MHQRIWGKSGFEVSAIGFGCKSRPETQIAMAYLIAGRLKLPSPT